MTARCLHFLVPGALTQRTGGYLYNARMVEGLGRRGWDVTVHSLTGHFPDRDTEAAHSFAATLAGLPDDATVVIDGLAMGAHPGPIRQHRARLTILGLVHLVLADETGLEPAERDRLLALEQDALRASAGVLVTSTVTADRVLALGVAPARVRSVVPGTDRADPATGPGDDSPPQLLCVAMLAPRKGQDVLVRALHRLRHHPWRCAFVGSLTRHPEFAKAVRDLVSELGLGTRVRFHGEAGADALRASYRASSVFVFPSHYESYGMALTEALAAGLPVVTTTGGAIPQTVPPDAALFVPPGDDAALAEAIEAALTDHALRDRLAMSGRRYVDRLPTWDDAAEVFAQALTELVAGGDP